MFSEISQMANM